MMEETLKRTLMDRGWELLETSRLKTDDRSPEKIAQMKERGRALLMERRSQERDRQRSVHTEPYSHDITEHQPQNQGHHQSGFHRNEEYTRPGTTGTISYVMPQTIDVVSDARTGRENISTSHDGMTAVIDYSVLDSVREQHERDVRKNEGLTSECLMLHEPIDKQQEELTQLPAEITHRETRIHSPTADYKSKQQQQPSHMCNVEKGSSGHFGHSQEEEKTEKTLHSEGHDNIPILEEHAEASLLVSKEMQIRELRSQLQQEILKRDKLEEENKMLTENKNALEEEIMTLTHDANVLKKELSESEEQRNTLLTSLNSLKQQFEELRHYHDTNEKTQALAQMEEELDSLRQQCAEAEHGREVAEAAVHRLETEMKAQQQRIDELEKGRHAEHHHHSSSSSVNPFARMSASFIQLRAANADDDDADVFDADVPRHPGVTSDAASGERPDETAAAMAELRQRIDELETELANAAPHRDSAMEEELDSLRQQCAEAEHGREVAEAAVHRLETEMKAQQQRIDELEKGRHAEHHHHSSSSSVNPFARMSASSIQLRAANAGDDDADDDADVFDADVPRHPGVTSDAASGERPDETAAAMAELRQRIDELETELANAAPHRDSAMEEELDSLRQQCAEAEHGREVAEAAVHRLETEMKAQQQRIDELEKGRHAEHHHRLPSSSVNPFARMSASSIQLRAANADDDDADVFDADVPRHPGVTSDAASGERPDETAAAMAELRQRIDELETELANAAPHRDSAMEEELDSLRQQCAEAEHGREVAEAAVHRLETEMKAQQQRIDELEKGRHAEHHHHSSSSSVNPFARMSASSIQLRAANAGDDDADVFDADVPRHPGVTSDAASGERPDETAAAMAELRQRIDELETELANAAPHRDSAMEEELDSLRQQCAEAEHGREVAEAAVHRLETEMKAQQQRIDELEKGRHAEHHHHSSSSSVNPFARMSASSIQLRAANAGDDDADVFDADVPRHPGVTSDAASGERPDETAAAMAELRQRIDELETELANAAPHRDSAMEEELDSLRQQCAEAEHGREVAEAAVHRLETEMKAQQQRIDELEKGRHAEHHHHSSSSSVNPFARMSASSIQLRAANADDDDADVFDADVPRHPGVTSDAASGERPDETAAAMAELRQRIDELETELANAAPHRDSAMEEELDSLRQQCAEAEHGREVAEAAVHRLETEMKAQQQRIDELEKGRHAEHHHRLPSSSVNPFARMSASSIQLRAANADDDDADVFDADVPRHPGVTSDAASGERPDETAAAMAELRQRIDELETELANAAPHRDSAMEEELDSLRQQCAEAEHGREVAEAAVHRLETEMKAQQQRIDELEKGRHAEHHHRLPSSSVNPFARMSASSIQLRAANAGDDDADVFDADVPRHPGVTSDAASGERPDETAAAMAELRQRIDELETELANAAPHRDSAMEEELDSLRQQCAEAEHGREVAEAAVHRLETEMKAQQQRIDELEKGRHAEHHHHSSSSSVNPFARMSASSIQLRAANADDDDADVFDADVPRHPGVTSDAASGERPDETAAAMAELRQRIDELETELANAAPHRDSAMEEELDSLRQQCAEAEHGREVAEAAVHRLETEMKAQQQRIDELEKGRHAEHHHRLPSSSVNPFARMSASSIQLRAANADDDDADVFDADVPRHPGVTSDAASGERPDETAAAMAELRQRIDELETELANAAPHRDSAMEEELDSLRQQCAEAEHGREVAEAAVHRLETEMKAQQQRIDELEKGRHAEHHHRLPSSSVNPFARMSASSIQLRAANAGDDDADVFDADVPRHPGVTSDAASGERPDETAAAMAELRQRIDELETELANAAPHRDSAMEEELDSLRQQCAEAEHGREVAEAAVHRLETEMKAQQQRIDELEKGRHAEHHHHSSSSSVNPFARMSASSIQLRAANAGDDDADVFDADVPRHPGVTSDAASGERPDETAAAMAELRQRIDELETELANAAPHRDSAMEEELDSLRQQCAEAEHGREVAEAAVHRLETEMKAQQQRIDELEKGRHAEHHHRLPSSSVNPFARMSASSIQLRAANAGDDDADVFDADVPRHPGVTSDAASGERPDETAAAMAELRQRIDELETELANAAPHRDSAMEEELDSLRQQCAEAEHGREVAEAAVHRLETEMKAQQQRIDELEKGRHAEHHHHSSSSSVNPFARMSASSIQLRAANAGDDDADVFDADVPRHPGVTSDAASGERPDETAAAMAELRQRIDELETELANAAPHRDSAMEEELDSLRQQCAEAEHGREVAEAAVHRLETEMKAQQQRIDELEKGRHAEHHHRLPSSSVNPFARMSASSIQLRAANADDDDADVFDADVPRHPGVTSDAVSGERPDETAAAMAELRQRIDELETELANAAPHRDSAMGEEKAVLEAKHKEELQACRQGSGSGSDAQGCLDALRAENAALKEELRQMQQSHEEELEAVVQEADDRIAEHDELLQAKLEEEKAVLEAKHKEELQACRQGSGSGSDAQGCLDALRAENAALKEELRQMQQSHEEELEAVVQEADDRIAEHDELLQAKLEEEKAVLEAKHKEELQACRQGSGSGSDAQGCLDALRAENAALKEELRQMQQSHEEELEAVVQEADDRIAEHDELLQAKLEEEKAVLEAKHKEELQACRQGSGSGSDAQGCLDALRAENAALKEELRQMQQSHEEELEAVVQEADDRIAEHDELLQAKLEEEKAVLEAKHKEELQACRQGSGSGSDAQGCLDALRAENAALKEELRQMQQSHEEELEAVVQEADDRIAEHDELLQAKLEEEKAVLEAKHKEELQACRQGSGSGSDAQGCLDALRAENAALKEELRQMQQSHEEELEAVVQEADDRIAEHDELLQAKLEEEKAVLEAKHKEELQACRQGSGSGSDAQGCLDALRAENAALKEELRQMQQSHEEELEAVVQEADDRIAEHDELLQAKLEEEKAVLEAKHKEELQACRQGSGSGSDAQGCLDALRAENAALKEELRQMQQSHEEELEAVVQEADDRIAEHDELLQAKLEEQEKYYEELLDEMLSSKIAVSDAAELSSSLNWKEEYDKLNRRFEELQGELESYLRDTNLPREDVEKQRATSGELLQTTPNEGGDAAGVLRAENVAALGEVEMLKGEILQLQRTEEQGEKRGEEKRVALEVRELRGQLKTKEKACSDLSQMCEDATSLLHDGATSVETVMQEKRDHIAGLELHSEKISQELISTQEQLRSLKLELQERERELEESTERHRKLEAMHRVVAAELGEIKRLFEERQRGWSQRIERLRGDMKKQQCEAAEEIHRVNCEHEREVAVMRCEVDRLRAELQAAQTVAATIPLAAEGNQHQLEHVRQQLTEAMNEKARLAKELEAAKQQLDLKNRAPLRDGKHSVGGGDSGGGNDDGQSSDACINSLLQRSESLEEKVRQLVSDKETLLQEKDALELNLQSAKRMVEARDLACQRYTGEVKQSRLQIDAMKDDLSFRVQSCNALRQELHDAQEQVAELASAYEDFQMATFSENRNSIMREYMESLFMAKVMTIPRVLQGVLQGFMQSHQHLLNRFSENQRNLLTRCDAIEQAATEAMMEGERQSSEFIAAIEDAKVEQQQLRGIIERLQKQLAAANRVAKESTEEAATIKEDVAGVKRAAVEEAAEAKRELQDLKLAYSSLLNTVNVLEAEKKNNMRMVAEANSRMDMAVSEEKKEVARLQEALREKKRQLRELHEAMEKKMDATEQLLEKCEAEREDAVKQAQKAQASLDRALPRLQQLEADRASREAALMDMTQQLTALSQCSTTTEEVTRRHMDTLTTTVTELRSTNVVLNEECTKAHSLVDELKNQLATAKLEIERLRILTVKQKEEIEDVYTKMRDAESSLVRGTNDAESLRRAVEGRNAALEHRNSVLEEDLQDSLKEQFAIQERCDTMEEKLRQTMNEYRGADQYQKRCIQQLQENCEVLESNLRELHETTTTLATERDALECDLITARKDVKRLEQYLDDTNKNNEQLLKELRRQKEIHDGELNVVRETFEAAQAELSQCRCTLFEAETREKEMQHIVNTLRKENSRYIEELEKVRKLANDEQMFVSREQAETRDRIEELEGEVSELQKGLLGAQRECRAMESRCMQSTRAADLLQHQLTEMTRHYNNIKQEEAANQQQYAETVKSLRAEVVAAQTRLEDVEDSLSQRQREHKQCEERNARKMELNRLSEENLRKEIADLQQDIKQLQTKLTSASSTVHESETIAAQQQMTIRRLTDELERCKAQNTTLLDERENLQKSLREKTLQLENVTRNATDDLEAAHTKSEEAFRANMKRLETSLRQERGAAQEARSARDRALRSLEQRQGECEKLQAKVTELQQTLRSTEAQLASIQAEVKSTVTQVAMETGVPQQGDLSLSGVVNMLLGRLSRLTHDTVMLDTEVSQFKSFEKVCEAHAKALRGVTDMARQQLQLASCGAAPNSPFTALHGSGSSGSSTHSLRQRQMSTSPLVLQDIISGASTYAHRLMDHCRTVRSMLDTMETAILRCDTSITADPAISKMKLIVMATLSELHLRTSRQTTLLHQIADGAIMSFALQDTVRVLHDDEAYILRPFNELLMPSASTPLSTSRWGGSFRHEGVSSTPRSLSGDNASASLQGLRAPVKKGSGHFSRLVQDPRQSMDAAAPSSEDPRKSSTTASDASAVAAAGTPTA